MLMNKPKSMRAAKAIARKGLALWVMLETGSAWALEVPQAVSVGHAVFYTLALTCVSLFSIVLLVARQYTWLSYSVYGGLMILLIAALDGTLAHLTGGGVWVMANTPLLIGAVAAAYGYFHAAYRLEAGHWLYSTRWLNGCLGVVMLALLPLYFLVPGVIPNLVPLYVVLNTGMLLMFVAQMLPPLTWTRLSKPQHRAAIMWPVTVGVVAVGAYGLHFAGPGFERATLDLINRILFALHLSHLLYFVCISIAEQMRAGVAARQAALEAAREVAEAELALERSERNFERARSLAHDRSRQLASASHDIKQPLAALRQVVERMAQGVTGPEHRRLQDAIDYLDGLAGSYLKLGNRGLDETEEYEIDVDAEAREHVDVGLILKTVAALHAEDAAAEGVDVRVRAAALDLHVAPLPLTRAISNLVGNALMHSGARRVLLLARKRGAGVRIEVHDNGCGMTADQLARAHRLRERGQDSAGSGIGIPIVQAQADERDWRFSLRSRPGHGTSAYILLGPR